MSDSLNKGAWQGANTGGSAATFGGVDDFSVYTNGVIAPEWTAAVGDNSRYNVYLRAGSSDIFSSDYLVCSVPNGRTSAEVLSLKDGTMLQPLTDYYLGVRSENGTSEDANTVVIGPFQVAPMGVKIKLPVNVLSK